MSLWKRLTGAGNAKDAARVLESSEAGRRILDGLEATTEAQRLDSRRALVARRDALQAEQSARVTVYESKRLALQARVDAARLVLAEAIHESAVLLGTFNSAQLTSSAAVDRIQAELHASASPLIAAFRQQLNAELQATSRRFDSMRERTAHGGDFTIWTNDASVRAREDAIIEARKRADALELEALDDAALADALDALLAGLPDVEPRPARELALKAAWS